MRFHRVKSAVLILSFVASVLAHSEGKEETGVMRPLDKEQKEFFEKTQRLNSLNTRIEEAGKQFNELVRRKSSEKNNEEKAHIIKQMNEAIKDRDKSVDEYMKVKSDLTLRYPNQGEHLNRRYLTQTKKSVEELEGAAGLDELLTRTKKIVEKKFAPLAPENDAKLKPKANLAQPEGEKSKRLRLEK